jgi:hypothetical protein
MHDVYNLELAAVFSDIIIGQYIDSVRRICKETAKRTSSFVASILLSVSLHRIIIIIIIIMLLFPYQRACSL